MKTKKPASNVDFADSMYKSFIMNEDYELTIHMINWEELPLKVVFKNTIQFSFSEGDFPKNLFEIEELTDFFKEALIREYGLIPTQHLFRLFHIEDIKGNPFIQVVAESVMVYEQENNLDENL